MKRAAGACAGAFCLLLALSAHAQETRSMDIWKSVQQTEAVVAFFDNLFIRIGIIVEDTGERFTCHHLGDRIEFEPGIGEVDYTVSIGAYQVERLARFARTGEIAEEEQFRVLKEVMTPATAALLRDPSMSKPFVKCASGAEDVIHVVLKSPLVTDEDVAHTLIYAHRQWFVFSGLHGKAQRLFTLSLRDAIEFQKASYRTIKDARCGKWMRFGRWYTEWREKVSQRL